MELTLKDRKSITKAFAKRYQFATKREKVEILNQFIHLTGFNRNYAARALRNFVPQKGKIKRVKKKGRKIYYDEDVQKALIKIWKVMDYICSKRLAPFIPVILDILIKFDEIKVTDETKNKLRKISASSIDRLLKSTKRSLGRKGTSCTKPGKYLIDQIPIKTFTEWNNVSTGYLQLDLVSHNAGDVFGGFMHTLNATDVCTGWVNCSVVKDKTMMQILKTLIIARNSFPFPVKGMHSDNGSEFINQAIVKFKNKYDLEFTRGRPYKKNDNPHVEQKNYSVVRRNTGYLRYDKPEHHTVLKELYEYLNLYNNYFQPIMILIEKHRKGSKVTRRYDTPETPYQRLLKQSDVPEAQKDRATEIYNSLNPAELKRIINDCQSKLIKMAAPIRKNVKPKKIRRDKIIKHTKPKNRREFIPAIPNPFLERQRIEELRRAAEKVWIRS
jgi:hypothetical protein